MARIPQRAGSVLQQWLAATGIDVELRPHVIAARWPRLVGPRIAARTSPRGLRDGTLTVEVANSAWLNELSFLREELLAAINGGLKDQPGNGAVVTQLRFVVGRPDRLVAPVGETTCPEPPRTPDLPDGPADDPLPGELDPELAAAIRRARNRARRGPG